MCQTVVAIIAAAAIAAGCGAAAIAAGGYDGAY